MCVCSRAHSALNGACRGNSLYSFDRGIGVAIPRQSLLLERHAWNVAWCLGISRESYTSTFIALSEGCASRARAFDLTVTVDDCEVAEETNGPVGREEDDEDEARQEGGCEGKDEEG